MMVSLLSGQTVDTDAITFDSDSYRFFVGDMEITDILRRQDKRRFPGFDDATENLRVYKQAHPNAPDTGPTGIWTNFYNQITTDPLDAPVELLERKVGGALDSTTGKVALALVAVAVLAFLYANRPRG